MILNSKEKIILNIISRNKIVIEKNHNKGIENYIKWLNTVNNITVNIEHNPNETIIISENKIKIMIP